MYSAAFAIRSRIFLATKYIQRSEISKIQNHPISYMRNYGKIAKPLSMKVKSKKKDDEENINMYGYFLLSIPIFTFILGTWQVQRRKWKLELIEKLQSRVSMEPKKLPEDLQKLESMEYCPVKVRGKFLHDKEFTFGPKSLIVDGTGVGEGTGAIISSSKGSTGFNIVTPFKLEDRDLTILVNRGWVPTKYKDPSTRSLGQIKDTVEIVGLVRLNEQRSQFMPKNNPSKGLWFYKDLEAMSEYAGTAPVYIELTKENHILGTPVGGQTRITLRNEHLTYIITWYSLSAATGYMWYRKFITKTF